MSAQPPPVRIEHMIERLERALAVVQEVFAEATARGTSVEMGELAGVVLGAQRVVNAASAVQAVGLNRPGFGGGS